MYAKQAAVVGLMIGLMGGMWPGAAALAAGCGDVPERCQQRREVLSWCEENRAECASRVDEYRAQCSDDDRDACHRAQWVSEFLGQGKPQR